ncbi:MAG: Outer rane protein assembly factor BamD [Gammaproteobacteria bacterium]|nr:Outer rane protein assembly factor BamD [Gammaproteobacteria bacterium]
MRITLIILLLLISGCSWLNKSDDEEARDWSVEKLYAEAKKAMEAGYYSRAQGYYEVLETRYPFGVIGRQSLLDLAFVYYKTEKYDEAVSACDRYIRLYPQNPAVDYAYYLKGLVNFERGKGLADRFLSIDDSQRDPGAALTAFQDFKELGEKFPDSIYMEDVQQRMIYLRNMLAQYEINVANYYMRRGAFVAAANRARYVVENYNRTASVPEALVIMAKCYKILEMNDLYDDAVRVLRMNYPEHEGIQELEITEVK